MSDLSCRRCGQCCLRGGPTLMREDAPLPGQGALPLEALVCLRAGEWARDDALGMLRPLDGELLKLAGTGESGHPWRCLYYRDGAGCGIYDRRPAQCRVLFCADTAPLEDMLAHGQSLDRRAVLETLADETLLPVAPSLCLELITVHDEACPAGRALALASALGFRPRGAAAAGEITASGLLTGDEKEAARVELAEMARYDAASRELCVTRGRAPAALLPFLLGRPLAALLAEVGLRAV